jgi:Secretion system C-terminal sorting domain/Papain family cysteine protease
MSVRSGVSALFILLLVVSSIQAEELHALGAIYSERPDWVLPSPIVPFEYGRELDEFVDNSAGLPPVGNQGSQGSCTSWATGYYYLTYTQGQDYGWDLTQRANQMSPAFTYNLINGGGDNGSNPYEAFELFETVGSATYEAMPYNQGIFTAFPSEEAFRGGLRFRTSATYDINTYSQAGINQLKTHIADGNIAMIAITVWPNFDSISQHDYNYCVNDITGEVRGGHAVTVIGYDDSRVTSDGVGAFRMVNSWGTGWGQSGFWWMSYEAFMSDLICWGYALYAEDIIQHEPTLVACIEPVHNDRYNLEYVVGAGTCDAPIASLRSFAFGWTNARHDYPANACIVLDMSDYAYLISDNQPNNLFVKVDDRRANNGSQGMVTNVMIEDLQRDHYATCYDMPVNIPDNQNDAEIDIVLYHAAVPPENVAADLDMTDGSTILEWPAVTGGDDFLGYNVYRNLELVAFTEDTQYLDMLPEFGEYDYQIASVWEPCQSWPTEAAHVNWITPVASTYAEVNQLDGDTGDFTLTWEQLRQYDVVYDDGGSDQEFVFSNAALPGAMFAQKYTAEENGKLTGITVYFPESEYPMDEVRFGAYSVGGDGMPDELLMSTHAFVPEMGHWKSMDLRLLRQSVVAGQELWLVVIYENVSCSAIGMDNNAFGHQKLLCPDGENWFPIGDGGALMIRAEFGSEELMNGDTGLLGFEVYEDGDHVASVSNDDEFEYSNTFPGAGAYTFRVDAVYLQGTWEGEELELTWDGFTAAEEFAVLPREFNVRQAYPNPFNPSTTIAVTMPVASELTVRVFNTLGQEVATLSNSLKTAGEHRLLFDASNLASGVYIVQVQVPGHLNERMKLVYLR